MTRDPCCTQKESGRLSCAPSAAPSSDSPPPGGHSAPCQPGLLGSERALPALWCCVLGWPRALRPQAGERQRGLRSPHLPSDSAEPRARRCRGSPNPSPGPRPPPHLCLPFPRAPAAPHTPPRTRTERTAPTTAAAARRSADRPRNLQAAASQLFPTPSRPAAATATAAPSEPATHPKPQKQTELRKGALPLPAPPPPSSSSGD